MTDQLKVSIELDLSKDNDRQLIEIISRVKALQAQGESPSIVAAAQQATETVLPTAQAMINTGKEVTKAANDLADKIPDQPRAKIDTVKRASLAAKARWERWKAKQEGRPLPPTSKELKKKSKAQNYDYARAEQQDLSQFRVEELDIQSKHEQVLNALMDTSHLPFPDGREIIDGSFRNRLEFQEGDGMFEPDNYDPMDDEFVRSVHERAKEY